MKSINIKLARNIAILLIFLTSSLPALAIEAKSLSEKAAVVNGVVITQKDLVKLLDLNLQRFSQQGLNLSKSQMVKLKNKILESLIDREILYQESQKSGIKVNKNTIDKEFSAFKKRFPSKDEYNKTLSSNQISEKDIKKQIKEKLAIDKLIDAKIAKKIVVSDKESKAFYDRHPDMFKQPEGVRSGHILIKVEPGADAQKRAEALNKIKDIQKKLKHGQDFAVLAREYSEDGASSANGGDLGYITRGETVKPFEDAVFGMKPNEVSGIVKTRFGYHLIKVYDKKPEKILAYGEIKDMLSESIKQEKTEEETIKYVADLKKHAKIEKYL
jgi:peptidyl-prolyl cis-trans isomerase C